jgi:hypothetical protein
MAESQKESKADKIIFVPSVFKHKRTQADIETAIETKIYEGSLKGEPGVYAYVGFDTTANPIEVFYNIIDNETMSLPGAELQGILSVASFEGRLVR